MIRKRIAITGATGFLGGHLARALIAAGHEVVSISRSRVGIDDVERLRKALVGCDAVAHCAGINREIGATLMVSESGGSRWHGWPARVFRRPENTGGPPVPPHAQTFQRVHVEGTRNVVDAARGAGVGKVVLVSFLRARPDCGSPYHESKWAAEQIVRASGLDYTILKPGVIYGRGDHMLDHLSRAFHTFPVFGLVGMRERPVRPVAVEDVVRVLVAALVGGRLSRQTVAVLGPEEMMLGEAVRRVARVVEKRPLFVRLPVWMHRALATLCWEPFMRVPLVSRAQVQILSEGIVEALPFAQNLPGDLVPRLRFTDEQIRRGLPEARGFGLADCRCLKGTT
jgi:NADH dehydrogenase